MATKAKGGSAAADPRVTKRKVTMASATLDAEGNAVRQVYEDYVLPEHLEVYVADARTRFQYVGVSDEPDAGPGGYDGDTNLPEHLLTAGGALRDPSEFAGYGDASTPYNALDELLIARGESPPYQQLGVPGQFSGGTAPRGGGGGLGGRLGPLLAPMGLLLTIMLTLAVVMTQLRLAIQTTVEKNATCSSYTGRMTHAALFSTVPGATAGTELTGGAPAYARKALAWGAPTNGVASASAVTFDVASGSTVAGAGLYDALTAGNYRDGGSVTSQAFASQGTYQLTVTATFT